MKSIRNGRFDVFTFKQGLLSAVAHDLQLSLMQFDIQFNGADVEASFNLNSLTVCGAVEDGRVNPKVLNPGDLAKIKRTIEREVLKVHRFPSARLTGRITDQHLVATLHLHGRAQECTGQVESEHGYARGAVELKPSLWGIKPYQALFGALKLEDRVVVEFEVELPV